MTIDEQARQLRAQARIEEFQRYFLAYMQQRAEQDQHQAIGRDCDTRFDRSENLERQRNEKIEKIDRGLDEDLHALEQQHLREKDHFESWMREQRERMRAEDRAQQRPETLEPRFVPSFVKPPEFAQSVTVRQKDASFAQRESLRNDAAEEMRKQFAEYQEQQHNDRLAILNERADQNREKLEAAFVQEVESSRAEYEKPLPWHTKEQTDEIATKAMEQAQQREQRDFTRKWEIDR